MACYSVQYLHKEFCTPTMFVHNAHIRQGGGSRAPVHHAARVSCNIPLYRSSSTHRTSAAYQKLLRAAADGVFGISFSTYFKSEDPKRLIIPTNDAAATIAVSCGGAFGAKSRSSCDLGDGHKRYGMPASIDYGGRPRVRSTAIALLSCCGQ